MEFYNQKNVSEKDYMEMVYGRVYGAYFCELHKLTEELAGNADWAKISRDSYENVYQNIEEQCGDNWKISYDFCNQ